MSNRSRTIRGYDPTISLTTILLFLLLAVFGSFASPVHSQLRIGIAPDTIDFGNVRVGHERDSFIVIEYFNNSNSGPQHATLLHLDSNAHSADFHVARIASPADTLLMNKSLAVDTDSVHFTPSAAGPLQIIPHVTWYADSGDTQYRTFILRGTGIAPKVISSGVNMGDVRVSDSSAFDTLRIVNIGNDSTAIDDVRIIRFDSDFSILIDSLPQLGDAVAPMVIGFATDTSVAFAVQFHPYSVRQDTAIIRIHTIDDAILYDTITGRGVEPLVLATPPVIDFGTITVQKNTSIDSTIDTMFFIADSGTFPAKLLSLAHDIASPFTVSLPSGFPQALSIDSAVGVSVQFHIVDEGDFADTVSIQSDARDSLFAGHGAIPFIILMGKVRTGALGPFSSISFDTVRTCDTISDSVEIVNEYPVEVHIDSIILANGAAGFSYRQSNFQLPINIAPDSSYFLHVDYSFPADSLNGPQTLSLILYQKPHDNEAPILDTLAANLYRKQQVLSLKPVLPVNASSATDVDEMKLPIMIEGPRDHVDALDGWTLKLTFSNDLFEPTSVDTTGSLSVPGDSTYLPLSEYWDQATRTYTIVARGTAVSDSIRFPRNLLLTLLLQAYVTTDTAVTVTPTFQWAEQPCAYNLQTFTLSIPYADDCGNPTIRAIMEHENPLLTIIGPSSNLNGGTVPIIYRTGAPCTLNCTAFDEEGRALSSIETSTNEGIGTVTFSESTFPTEGPVFLRFEAVSLDGTRSEFKTCRIVVLH
ncbi:MAG TPA: hypothetical protein VGM92_07820 [Candidatus Kapabacteria bacterium]